LVLEKKNRDVLEEKLTEQVGELTGSPVEREDWERVINNLKRRRNQLAGDARGLELELATLNLTPEEYRLQPASAGYDEDALARCQSELAQVETKLNTETNELNSLKQRISERTGDDISLDLDQLLEHLQQKRVDVSVEYRELTATIMAGILVNEQLEVIREEEEQTIKANLESEIVAEPIHKVTGRYTGIRYEGGVIYLDHHMGSYPISDLSTGALEQVLLALRLGFASKVFEERKLFLILDDAFQHADWNRRRLLVDKAVVLANEGWQIIYFTMDDNIRDLFDAAGKQHFPGSYEYYDLNETVEVSG
jgi:uncharacterized protein YhaN